VGGDTHIIRRTLSELERELGEEKFIRIHRSIIVNLDWIHGLELQSGGEYEVIVKSKVRLRLSRRFRKRLQDRMDAMLEALRRFIRPREHLLAPLALNEGRCPSAYCGTFAHEGLRYPL
jgi:hypothetical protein